MIRLGSTKENPHGIPKAHHAYPPYQLANQPEPQMCDRLELLLGTPVSPAATDAKWFVGFLRF